jgi:hypothetical protein
VSQLRPRGDERYDAPVISAQELPQHEQSEQLRLCVVSTREPDAILRQRRLARSERLPCHLHRQLRHLRHPLPSPEAEQIAQASEGLQQRKTGFLLHRRASGGACRSFRPILRQNGRGHRRCRTIEFGGSRIGVAKLQIYESRLPSVSLFEKLTE